MADPHLPKVVEQTVHGSLGLMRFHLSVAPPAEGYRYFNVAPGVYRPPEWPFAYPSSRDLKSSFLPLDWEAREYIPVEVQQGIVPKLATNPFWVTDGNFSFSTQPPTYEIGGVVSQRVNGVDTPIGGTEVRLYARGPGLLIASTHTHNNGSYNFTDLPRFYRGYYVVALDQERPQLQNALIYDWITPGTAAPLTVRAPRRISMWAGVEKTFSFAVLNNVGWVTVEVEGEVPEGMVIAPADTPEFPNQLRVFWSVPKDAEPAVYPVTIKVTDELGRTTSVVLEARIADPINALDSAYPVGAGWLTLAFNSLDYYTLYPVPLFGFTFSGALAPQEREPNAMAGGNSVLWLHTLLTSDSRQSGPATDLGLSVNSAPRSINQLRSGLSPEGYFVVDYLGAQSQQWPSTVNDSNHHAWQAVFYPDGTISLFTRRLQQSGRAGMGDGTTFYPLTTSTYFESFSHYRIRHVDGAWTFELIDTP